MKNLFRVFPIIGILASGLFQCLEVSAADQVLVDAAKARWMPMAASPAAETVQVDGREVVRFRCDFATTTCERASWDVHQPLDLSSASGIQFDLLCTNPAPISSFVAYFESPPGWYRCEFSPESVDGWETIVLDKARAHPEGQPGGWDKVRTFRVSAWRGQDRDTQFLLGDLRATDGGADAPIAVLRADGAARKSADEAGAVERYATGLADGLRAVDLPFAVVSDEQITAKQLSAFKLVVLPYNPGMSSEVAEAVRGYVAQGGRILVFYTAPRSVLEAIGVADGAHVRQRNAGDFAAIRFVDDAIAGAPREVGQQSWNINDWKAIADRSRVVAEWRDASGRAQGHAAVIASSNGIAMTHVLLPDDPAGKRRMLMGLVGHLVPELWARAAQTAIERIPRESGFATFEVAEKRIVELGGTAKDARAERDAAVKARAEGRHAAAVEHAGEASRALLAAWCSAQKPQAGEFRAFWCHDAFGVSGLTWDEAIARLATNGFTAIVPNLLWGGVAHYESDVLPVAQAVRDRGDALAACVAACRKHGLQVHVWKVNWNLGWAAPREFVDRMRAAGRLQADAKGEELAWLCPSHPDNQKLEIDAMVEVVRKYDVDGIHFDYIRYPDDGHCVCAGCRARFEAALGQKLEHWPDDVGSKGALRSRWLDWRRGNISAVVEAVSGQARALKPKIKVSAAVFPHWTTDRDSIGQDWKHWCERGWLDFVCPMDYTASNRKFESLVTAQKEWAGRVPCYPGIGVSASSSQFGPARVIDQIGIARRLGTGGFIIFNYGVAESRDLLPLLGAGITRRVP